LNLVIIDPNLYIACFLKITQYVTEFHCLFTLNIAYVTSVKECFVMFNVFLFCIFKKDQQINTIINYEFSTFTFDVLDSRRVIKVLIKNPYQMPFLKDNSSNLSKML